MSRVMDLLRKRGTVDLYSFDPPAVIVSLVGANRVVLVHLVLR